MSELIDRNILDRFYSILYPDSFLPSEGVFMASAVRRKYMTKEEAEELHINNEASMIRKRFIRTNTMERVYCAIKEMLDVDTILTSSDLHPPLSAMVVYTMIGTSNVIKAYQGFKKTLADVDCEIISLMATGSRDLKHPIRKLSHIEGLWYTELQKVATSNWLDFDVDLEDTSDESRAYASKVIDKVMKEHAKGSLHCMKVNTHGGIHLLVQKSSDAFDKNFNPPVILSRLKDELKDRTSEIIISKSHMIPCPGTRQAGYMVNFEEVVYD